MADLVALRLPTATDVARAIEQVWAAGDAAVVVPDRLAAPAAETLLERLRPARLVTDAASVELPGAVPVPDGTAVVVATSGSTGAPKGVVLPHAALAASARASVAALGCGPESRWLCCLPLDHVAGLQVLRRAAVLGHEPVVLDGFDVAAVAAAPVTHLSLVPTQLARLLAAGADLAGRHVLLGGAAAPAELLERAAEAGARVVVSYGMTETCGGCVYDGRPIDGVEVRVRGDGRILLRGDVLMTGYHRDETATGQAFDTAGWFVTADHGRVEEDGRLTVRGRADDVIVTGGENVAAAAVADVLADHPAVAAAAVVGLPDPEWGQRVVAVVVPAPHAAPTLAELRDHVGERLGRHAAPRELHLTDRLPTSGLGKPDAAALRRLVRRPEP